MKIKKKYSFSKVNWILLPNLLDAFITSIPEKEFLEGQDRRYEVGLKFQVNSLDKVIVCHSNDEFLEVIKSLNSDEIEVNVIIECLRHTYTDFESLVNTSPDYFQFRWELNGCVITIERNVYSNASVQIKKFEDVLLLKKFEKEEKAVITKRKRTAFIAHPFDAIGESYAFNLGNFLNHLNFKISTGK